MPAVLQAKPDCVARAKVETHIMKPRDNDHYHCPQAQVQKGVRPPVVIRLSGDAEQTKEARLHKQESNGEVDQQRMPLTRRREPNLVEGLEQCAGHFVFDSAGGNVFSSTTWMAFASWYL